MSGKPKRWGNCSFCGRYKLTTKEHVFPRGIYPPSSANSKIQRITIPACRECNSGTSDDDAHFRNVITVAGDKTAAVSELWQGPIRRGFSQIDGSRRAHDILKIMRPAPDVGPDRYRIFPAEDPRILRSIRKIVRGLSQYHKLSPIVSDAQVFADIQKENFSEQVIDEFRLGNTDFEICAYGYVVLDGKDGIMSAWIVQFFRRTSFVAFICTDEGQYNRIFDNNLNCE